MSDYSFHWWNKTERCQQNVTVHEYKTSLLASFGAAGVVDHQHDINTIMLHQLHEEGTVTHRVKANRLHVVGSQLSVMRHGDVQKHVEKPVVQLHEVPEGEDSQFQHLTVPCDTAVPMPRWCTDHGEWTIQQDVEEMIMELHSEAWGRGSKP